MFASLFVSVLTYQFVCLRLFLGDNCHVVNADDDATNDVLGLRGRGMCRQHPEPSVILDKDGDADDDADNYSGDADFLLCDNPELQTSNDTSNDHVSNFAETHRHLWQR